MSDTITPEEVLLIRDTHEKVVDVLNTSGLDAYGLIAVLTKALVDYAVLVEDRDDFHMRMAMTYDFVKSQQPTHKEIH